MDTAKHDKPEAELDISFMFGNHADSFGFHHSSGQQLALQKEFSTLCSIMTWEQRRNDITHQQEEMSQRRYRGALIQAARKEEKLKAVHRSRFKAGLEKEHALFEKQNKNRDNRFDFMNAASQRRRERIYRYATAVKERKLQGMIESSKIVEKLQKRVFGNYDAHPAVHAVIEEEERKLRENLDESRKALTTPAEFSPLDDGLVTAQITAMHDGLPTYFVQSKDAQRGTGTPTSRVSRIHIHKQDRSSYKPRSNSPNDSMSDTGKESRDRRVPIVDVFDIPFLAVDRPSSANSSTSTGSGRLAADVSIRIVAPSPSKGVKFPSLDHRAALVGVDAYR